MIATLTFGPDGMGRCLYTEVIDLRQLGDLHVERATSIEFENVKQTWRVRDAEGRLIFTARTRQRCLDWERERFNH